MGAFRLTTTAFMTSTNERSVVGGRQVAGERDVGAKWVRALHAFD
jgi:hypothetical protein